MKKILTSLLSVSSVLILIAIAVTTHTSQGMIIVPLLVTVIIVTLVFIFEYLPAFKYKRLAMYVLLTCAGVAVVLFLLKSKSEVTLVDSDEKFKTNNNVNNIGSTSTKKFKITNNKDNIVSTSTLSSRGETVSVSFIACGSADANFCFGDSAVRIKDAPQNVLMWGHLISTNNLLSFGIQSRVGNKWPYMVDIDFGERAYDSIDYDFFKNKIQELFFENIKVSQ